jgi:hypothetical protein
VDKTRKVEIENWVNMSDIAPLNPTQEEELARWMGVSLKEVMVNARKAPPRVAKNYASKLMPLAISAANKAAVLRRRGVLSPDAERLVREIVGAIGLFLGKGKFKSTFTTMRVFGEEDKILATCTEHRNSRRPTKKLVSELFDDLSRLKQGGKEQERIIPKSSDNYLLESAYLSIATHIQGYSESATTKLYDVRDLAIRAPRVRRKS